MQQKSGSGKRIGEAASKQEAADFVRQARLKMGVKQAVFAEKFGIGQSLLSKYELGRIDPPAGLLLECMKILETQQVEVTQNELLHLVTTRLKGAAMNPIRVALANVIACLPSAR